MEIIVPTENALVEDSKREMIKRAKRNFKGVTLFDSRFTEGSVMPRVFNREGEIVIEGGLRIPHSLLKTKPTYLK